MKNRLPIILLSSLMFLGVAACGGNSSSISSVEPVTVNNVTISGYTEKDLTVFDGTTFSLKATVDGTRGGQPVTGLKVKWQTSDESIAKVTNGKVAFQKVSEEKDVTISAVSSDDETKKAEVTFHVKHSLIDFTNSRGNVDFSMFMEDGSLSADWGDIAYIFSDVHSNKFYVEGEITIDEVDFGKDKFPKFGIMVGTSEFGAWNGSSDQLINKNAFFYVDVNADVNQNEWNSWNMVSQNGSYTDWDWGAQRGGFNTTNHMVKVGESFKMGLLRNGRDYFLYAQDEKDGPLVMKKSLRYDRYQDLATDEATYAWIGGFATSSSVKNLKVITDGAELDQRLATFYETPTSLSVSTLTAGVTSGKLATGSTYQMIVNSDKAVYDHAKLKFDSTDKEVATVDAEGLITAGTKIGTTTISATYEGTDMKTQLTITTVPNSEDIVTIDGKMDEAIYTTAVKTNKYQMKSGKDGRYYVDFYGTRNNNGIYLYADYHAAAVRNVGDEWWQRDNIELRVGTKTKPDLSGQVYASVTKAKQGCAEAYFGAMEGTDGDFHSTVEMYIPYSQFGFFVDEVVMVGFGCNPALDEGFYTSPNWTSGFCQITTDGFTDFHN